MEGSKFIVEDVTYTQYPICASSIKKWRSKRGADHQNYKIDSCINCRYSFVNPRPPLQYLMRYYTELSTNKDNDNVLNVASVLNGEKKEPNSTLDAKRMLRTIKDLLGDTNEKKILDIGCGYGFFSQEALSYNFKVTAIELGAFERTVTKELTGIDPLNCSFEEYIPPPPLQFDVILMSQILEHALDINLWIKKAQKYLVNGGILCIALPNFSSIFRKLMQEKEPLICSPEHLNFFSLKNLVHLLAKYDFVVDSVNWQSRLPVSAFENRLPSFMNPLVKVIHSFSKIALKIVDNIKLGSVINVYARKQS